MQSPLRTGGGAAQCEKLNMIRVISVVLTHLRLAHVPWVLLGPVRHLLAFIIQGLLYFFGERNPV